MSPVIHRLSPLRLVAYMLQLQSHFANEKYKAFTFITRKKNFFILPHISHLLYVAKLFFFYGRFFKLNFTMLKKKFEIQQSKRKKGGFLIVLDAAGKSGGVCVLCRRV
jgi:hypothetical protein